MSNADESQTPANEPVSGEEVEGGNAAETLANEALRAAQEAISGLSEGGSGGSEGAPAAMRLPEFGAAARGGRQEAIDLLADVNLNVKIELGRTRMLVEDVLRLGEGSVVELDKLAGDPVDIYVNDRPVARGEVLVLNDNFCVRINEILAENDGALGG